jgi:hypothetical protein
VTNIVKFENEKNVRKFIDQNNEVTKLVIKGMAKCFAVPYGKNYTKGDIVRNYLFERERKLAGLIESFLTREEKLLLELGKMEGRREALILLETEAARNDFKK